jgi:hypothetical protein
MTLESSNYMRLSRAEKAATHGDTATPPNANFPTRLVIGYAIAEEPHDLTLALPSLAGLHLKPTEAVRSGGRSDVTVAPTEP